MPTFIEVARGATLLLVCALLAIAGVSDVRTRQIPNWTVLALMGLFCVWFFMGVSAPLLSALGAALVVFVCSFSLYAFGIVGAGDSKLASAVALFAGVSRLPEFILYMGVAGGLLVLCMMAAEPARALVMLQLRGRASALERNVPYGVAIAVAGALLLLRSVLSW